jgi:hypothetical protein
MPEWRYPKIASVLVVTIFWYAGYLVGANTQKMQLPQSAGAVTPNLMQGAEAETVALDPNTELTWPLVHCIGIPPRRIFVYVGSDCVFNEGGGVLFPLSFTAGHHTISNATCSVIYTVVKGLAMSRFPMTSSEDFY